MTFPPFGYVTPFDSPPPHRDQYEVTHSARCHYDDEWSLPLRLPVLPVYSWLPVDYRTQEQIMADMTRNMPTTGTLP
jgi:hypothetical protein